MGMGGGGSTSGSVYTPPKGDVAGMFKTLGTGSTNLYNVGQTPTNPLNLGSDLPGYLSDINQFLSLPTDQMTANINAASNMGLGAASMGASAMPQMFGTGSALMGSVPGMMGAGNAMLGHSLGQMGTLDQQIGQMGEMAFDPQGDYYNRMLAQPTQQQIRAATAASGLSGPAAAGIEAQGMSDLNLNWQNQLLQRAVQGTQGLQGLYGIETQLPQGAESLYGAAGTLGTQGAGVDQTGMGIGTSAYDLAKNASALPYEMQQAILQGRMGARDAYTQAQTNAYNQQQSGLNALMSYLNEADQASKTAVAQQGQNLQSQQAGLNDMMSMLALPFAMKG